jgi:transposase
LADHLRKAHRIVASKSAVQRFCRKQGIRTYRFLRGDPLKLAAAAADLAGLKKARRRGAAVVFVDETGFSYQVEAGTTWAPKGRTPVLRTVSERRQVSTAIGLTTPGRIYEKHFDHANHGEDMVALLERLRRRVGGPMILIRDRLRVHRSAVVKESLARRPEVGIEWLSEYAPDSKPEEGCHGDVKSRLSNAAPETEEEIRRDADRGFARLRRRQDPPLGFLHHAGLRPRDEPLILQNATDPVERPSPVVPIVLSLIIQLILANDSRRLSRRTTTFSNPSRPRNNPASWTTFCRALSAPPPNLSSADTTRIAKDGVVRMSFSRSATALPAGGFAPNSSTARPQFSRNCCTRRQWPDLAWPAKTRGVRSEIATSN